jgi:serine/threonine protein kinase
MFSSGPQIYSYEKRKYVSLLKYAPKICKRMGVTSRSKKLGSGGFGTVWSTESPDFVVKVSSSFVEAENTRKILGMKIPGVAYYDSVESVNVSKDDESPQFIYFIRMEKLNQPPEWIHNLASKYGMPGKRRKGHLTKVRWNEPKTPEERRFYQQIEHAWLQLKRLGITHTDVHTGNIMCDANGKFKLIDAM